MLISRPACGQIGHLMVNQLSILGGARSFYTISLPRKTEQLFEVDGSIFVISWWRHEVLPVAPKQKLTTTWGEVKRTLR